MTIFKSYLRLLIRRLEDLEKANNADDSEEVKRLISELLKDAKDGLEDD